MACGQAGGPDRRRGGDPRGPPDAIAKGQLSYLNLTNAVLRKLGKAQTDSSSFASVAADSWPGLVKSTLNEAQQELARKHDWSSLFTSGTFTTSSRTYDLSASFTGLVRAIDLVTTTNNRLLVPITPREIDAYDPGLDDAGSPTHYALEYPNLLFNRTPSSEAFRLRYLTRATDLSASTDVSSLPEYCDRVLILWATWELLRTREDLEGDALTQHRDELRLATAEAIHQDKRRATDRVWVMAAFRGPSDGPITDGPIWGPEYGAGADA